MQGASATEKATAVTYGGQSLSKVTGGSAADTANEPGRVTAWFLGTGLPTGAQNVVVTRTNDTTPCYAVAFLLGGSDDTFVTGTPVLQQENAAMTAVTIDDGLTSPGTSIVLAGGYSGDNTPAPAGSTGTTSSHTLLGTYAYSFGSGYETTPTYGSRSRGLAASSDDRAQVVLAVTDYIEPTVFEVAARIGGSAKTAAPASIQELAAARILGTARTADPLLLTTSVAGRLTGHGLIQASGAVEAQIFGKLAGEARMQAISAVEALMAATLLGEARMQPSATVETPAPAYGILRFFYDTESAAGRRNSDTYSDGPSDPFGDATSEDKQWSFYLSGVGVPSYLPLLAHLVGIGGFVAPLSQTVPLAGRLDGAGYLTPLLSSAAIWELAGRLFGLSSQVPLSTMDALSAGRLIGLAREQGTGLDLIGLTGQLRGLSQEQAAALGLIMGTGQLSGQSRASTGPMFLEAMATGQLQGEGSSRGSALDLINLVGSLRGYGSGYGYFGAAQQLSYAILSGQARSQGSLFGISMLSGQLRGQAGMQDPLLDLIGLTGHLRGQAALVDPLLDQILTGAQLTGQGRLVDPLLELALAAGRLSGHGRLTDDLLVETAGEVFISGRSYGEGRLQGSLFAEVYPAARLQAEARVAAASQLTMTLAGRLFGTGRLQPDSISYAIMEAQLRAGGQAVLLADARHEALVAARLHGLAREAGPIGLDVITMARLLGVGLARGNLSPIILPQARLRGHERLAAYPYLVMGTGAIIATIGPRLRQRPIFRYEAIAVGNAVLYVPIGSVTLKTPVSPPTMHTTAPKEVPIAAAIGRPRPHTPYGKPTLE